MLSIFINAGLALVERELVNLEPAMQAAVIGGLKKASDSLASYVNSKISDEEQKIQAKMEQL